MTFSDGGKDSNFDCDTETLSLPVATLTQDTTALSLELSRIASVTLACCP